ncbi:pta1 mRNA cleavage and polyadenylation specificity factor complex subunit pta1 [Candida maltosa Xu316]
MSSSPTLQEKIKILESAKEFVKSRPNQYSETFHRMLQIVISQPDEKEQHKWIVGFMYDTFINNQSLDSRNKTQLAIQSLEALTILTNFRDIPTFSKIIDISCVVFRMVFEYVAANNNSDPVWSKLTELKNSVINKFTSNFPLDASDNQEHDMVRNLVTKLDLLKFLMTVIDITTATRGIGEPIPPTYSLNDVPPNHSLIKYGNMENEAQSIFKNIVLKVFDRDIIIPPLVTATLNHCIVIMKKKPQLVPMLLESVIKYDTNSKSLSNYQSVEQFKLAKKYVDRNIRIFIQHCQKYKLIPREFDVVLNKKAKELTDRGVDIRKKNIFAIKEDIKKRKFEGFYNPSKRLKKSTYKDLYTLNSVNNELNNYDLSNTDKNTLLTLVLTALQKAPVQKLVKGLEIVSDRFKYASENSGKGMTLVKNEPAQPTIIKRETNENEIDSEDEAKYGDKVDEDFFNPEKIFTLPPPKEVSFHEKKQHISIIINNFIEMANKDVGFTMEDEALLDADDNGDITKALKKVAIKGWKKGNWVILLTRIASRGMRVTKYDDPDGNASPDEKNRQEMGDLIRNEILKYCSTNVHSTSDIIIDWLNEEWYSERVFKESELINEGKDPETEEIKTPIYDKWCGKVIDSIVNYIEPQDKRLFVRVVSGLPELSETSIRRIKSLCYDPVKADLGFMALHFLVMYRPPVKDLCLKVLNELHESDQEDTKVRAGKILAKYV